MFFCPYFFKYVCPTKLFALCIFFFKLSDVKVPCSFHVRPLSELIPRGLWVLKGVSLLWGDVLLPSIALFWVVEHSQPFFPLLFSVTCKHWSISPLGSVKPGTLFSVSDALPTTSVGAEAPLLVCLVGKYFHRPTLSHRCWFAAVVNCEHLRIQHGVEHESKTFVCTY